MTHLMIGTRGSALALAQAGWVKQKIEKTGRTAELLVVKTSGDRLAEASIQSLGGKGFFTKELEDALLAGEIDLAVHSMKDLPTELPDGLAIAAVPPREDPRDVLVSRKDVSLKELPYGARIATGSLRRSTQMRFYRPDFVIVPIRGNVDTRLRKLDSEDFDALVLAAAGLRRLGRSERITEYLTSEICLSAVAQGALGIETRSDSPSRRALAFMNHEPSWVETMAERAFLRRLGGGCHVPVAARAVVQADVIEVMGLVADTHGRQLYRAALRGPVAESEGLGTALAEQLLEQGAGEILAGIVGRS